MREKVERIDGDSHSDIVGISSLYSINNISSLKNLKQLQMPYAFNPINNEDDAARDVLTLIKKDQLNSLSIEVKVQNEIIEEVFKSLSCLKTLEELQMSVTTSKSFIEFLNKGLNRDSKIKHLDINFVHSDICDNAYRIDHENPQPTEFELKFPRYMKHLKSLHLSNIYDKNFTETLFDCASRHKLKELSLSMITDQQSLPNFSEALEEYTSLEKLHLSRIKYSKINHGIFFKFIKGPKSSLRTLSLDYINFTDD